MPVKGLVGLIALALTLCACASDANETTTTTSAEAESSETTDGESGDDETDDPEADGTETASSETTIDEVTTTVEEQTSTSSSTSSTVSSDSEIEVGVFLDSFLSGLGIEPTEEMISCIEGVGADPMVGRNGTEEEGVAFGLAIATCFPEELAALAAANYPPTPGVVPEDVECVALEAYGRVSERTLDEAIKGPSELPPEARADIVSRSEESCGVTAELAEDVIEFMMS